MEEGKKATLSDFTIRRSPLQSRTKPQIFIHTIKAEAIIPIGFKSIARNRSEPRTQKSKPTFRRPVRQQLDSMERSEALTIQSSQPVLQRIAKVLTARERSTRNPCVLEKYNRLIHLPTVHLDPSHEETELAISFISPKREESADSNELDIDVRNFISDEKKEMKVKVTDLSVDEVFNRRLKTERSPLTSVNRMNDRGSEDHLEESIASRSFFPTIAFHSLKHITPKPSARSSEEDVAFRKLQPHRISVEMNNLSRIRWMQKNRFRLRKLVD